MKNYGLTITTMAAMVSLVMLASVVQAAQPEAAAETLASANANGVTFIHNTDGSVTVQFRARSTGHMLCRADGVADLGVASGAFVGDYTAAGIRGLTFGIKSNGYVPLTAMVVLHEANGQEWQYGPVEVSGVAGEVVVNTISMDYEAGWQSAFLPGTDLEAKWDAALKNVRDIGLRLQPATLAAEAYTVADFMLAGPNGFTLPANLGRLGQALQARFGKSSLDELGALGSGDSDGDGASDLAELLAGTDEDNAADVFAAEVLGQDAGGTTISWSSASDLLIYKVKRATSLTSGFSLVAEGLTLDSPEITVTDGFMVWKDTSISAGSAPCFYRVLGDAIAE
ncbi:MAG: hypothetical protein HN919_16530 [Verrucomicrobia bacterium]|jgi:hypothetical protein|nr:hypothetical protein [Verrucomicrobiota bacterium]MBT7067907.1 hypothetical protein [Verrucomicrobiota bacterium]MBT7701819.1 hypothetical protein [Verrucomicrobiota bacterium]